MRTPKFSLLVAGLCLSLSALAADADRWEMPVGTKKLDNGLTVVVSRRPQLADRRRERGLPGGHAPGAEAIAPASRTCSST